MLSADEIVRLYRKRAGNYDLTANAYYLLGFREWAYRQKAVDALQLKKGDTVVEIGCGTGLNFPLLQRAVGPDGKIIGVDLTDAMLEQAGKRVAENGWRNVVLIQTDASAFTFPKDINGILSTFAFSMMPEQELIIAHGFQALAARGRWVVLDLRIPPRLAWLAPLFILVTRAFGVNKEWVRQKPWNTIIRQLNGSYAGFYWGVTFIASGEKKEVHHA
ncbi:MAG TPA: methyltransferase domain-containing protein [Mariprofundaceae bacterium]|nr:methyltransferase domain-containing protein [Mariprofundaceae bacterium]